LNTHHNLKLVSEVLVESGSILRGFGRVTGADSGVVQFIRAVSKHGSRNWVFQSTQGWAQSPRM